LGAVVAESDALPGLALFDASAATLTGGEKKAPTTLSYSWKLSGGIRLLCEGPGSSQALARVVEGARSRLELEGALEVAAPIRAWTYQSRMLHPLWILALAPLGLLGFLALSALLDLIGVKRAKDR
jgi:hypothetical protein